MTGREAVLNDIITLLTGGITGMAKGIGSGLKELVTKSFLKLLNRVKLQEQVLRRAWSPFSVDSPSL